MKPKIEITKVDFDFKVNEVWIKIRWTFIEKRLHVGRMLPFYKIQAIFPLHQNRVSEESWETCLQVNTSNSTDFLKRILKFR